MQFLIGHRSVFTDTDLVNIDNHIHSMVFNKPTPIFLIQAIGGEDDDDLVQNISFHRIRIKNYENLKPGAFIRLKRVKKTADLAQLIEETKENPDQCVATVNNGKAWCIQIVKTMPKKAKKILDANIENKENTEKFWKEFRIDLSKFDSFFQPKHKLDPKKFTPYQIKRADEQLCINCNNEIEGVCFSKDVLEEVYEKTGLCQECQYDTGKIVEDLPNPEEYLKKHRASLPTVKNDAPEK